MTFFIFKSNNFIIACLFAIFLLSSNFSYSQKLTSYSFGVIGNVGGELPVYSSYIDIAGANCLLVTSGIKTFQSKSNYEFTDYCEVVLPNYIEAQLTLHPNPIATNSVLKLKESISFIKDDKVELQIFKQNGELVRSQLTTLSQLNNGINIQLNNSLINGVYFIKAISVNKIFKPIIIFKQN